MSRPPASDPFPARTGVARALSKLGYCSRAEGWRLVEAGRVRVNGRPVRDPETPVRLGRDRIDVEGQAVERARPLYLMLNKPRGLVTTARDEAGRETVFRCFEGAGLPQLSPVGRLDQASEGLLLFTNDHAWGNWLTAPDSHMAKVYHVQVEGLVDANLLDRLRSGVDSEVGHLSVTEAQVLRTGSKNCWLEVVLQEGRNRQIRRLLAAFDLEVLRLIRISIGSLVLGDLAKGAWRHLTPAEARALGPGTKGSEPQRPRHS